MRCNLIQRRFFAAQVHQTMVFGDRSHKRAQIIDITVYEYNCLRAEGLGCRKMLGSRPELRLCVLHGLSRNGEK